MTLAQKSICGLISASISLMRKTISVTPNQVNDTFIVNAFKNLGLLNGVVRKDDTFYTITWNEWQNVLEIITSIMASFPWIKETFDCDNRAIMVKTLADSLTGLNTMGTAYGYVYHATTGAMLFKHYWNTIITTDGKLHIFDIDNYGGTITEIEKGKPMIGRNWRYEIITAEWY
jgi:hypothetical protein